MGLTLISASVVAVGGGAGAGANKAGPVGGCGVVEGSDGWKLKCGVGGGGGVEDDGRSWRFLVGG